MGDLEHVMKPEVVTKDDLIDKPYELSPQYNFKVVTSESLSEQMPGIIITVDTLFAEYSDCMNITDNGEAVRRFVIAVVHSTFTCNHHHGKCNGEYDPHNELIVVGYKAFERSGTLPLLQHEWAHAYGDLKSDHSNLKSVKHCIKY
jgi:hypothetical protein